MTAVVYAVVHVLTRGHVPAWEKVDYDFLTFRWRCFRCAA